MQRISVVIICRNEEAEIGRCLDSLDGLTDDVVVLDNGSTDATKDIVRQHDVRLVEDSWEGFGKTKNKATRFAKYDWIINLDADESIDLDLKGSLLAATFENEDEVFEVRFKNYFGNTHLRFGEWGGDRHIRVFNRKRVKWDEANVHESLMIPQGVSVRRLMGHILHYTVQTEKEFAAKMLAYGRLSAEKYAEKGKKSSSLKVYIAPVFTFLKYYVFKLGFLDGKKGLICARMTSYYTFIKYARLLELNKSQPR